MIINEQQYQRTKTQAGKFQAVLDDLRQAPARADIHPLLVKAQADAIRSQLDDLHAELADYKSRRAQAAEIRWSDLRALTPHKLCIRAMTILRPVMAQGMLAGERDWDRAVTWHRDVWVPLCQEAGSERQFVAEELGAPHSPGSDDALMTRTAEFLRDSDLLPFGASLEDAALVTLFLAYLAEGRPDPTLPSSE